MIPGVEGAGAGKGFHAGTEIKNETCNNNEQFSEGFADFIQEKVSEDKQRKEQQDKCI